MSEFNAEKEFPSNSNKTKLKAVVKNPVTKRQKSPGKKLAETFFEEDSRSIVSYILQDVLLPSAKDLFHDMATGAIEMALYGGRKQGGGKNHSNKGRVNYNSMASRQSPSERSGAHRISQNSRSRHDFSEVYIETRGEAEDVLQSLIDLTIDYDQATVADFYDLVGETTSFTDHSWGWTDLSSAYIKRAGRNGFLVMLPKTQPIK